MLPSAKEQLVKNLQFLSVKNSKYLDMIKDYDFENHPFDIERIDDKIVVIYDSERYEDLEEFSSQFIENVDENIKCLYYDITYDEELSLRLKELIRSYISSHLTPELLLDRMENLIILGLFPIFHIEKLIEFALEKNIKNIEVYEIDIGIFMIFLSLIDLEKLSSLNIQINFHISPDISQLIEVFDEHSLFLLKNGVFTGIVKSYSTPKMDKLEEEFIFLYQKGLLKTHKEFFPTVVENFLTNFPQSIFFNRAKIHDNTLSAVVVGSGPSLEKDLAYLKENQDRLYICALSSAARILILNGIYPDTIFVIDPMLNLEKNAIFKDVEKEVSKSFLIDSIHVSPSLKGLFEKSGTVFLDVFQLCFQERFFEDYFKYFTVLNVTAGFLFEAKVRNIYLFGVDLATDDPKKIHAKGYFKEDDAIQTYKKVTGNLREKTFYSPMDYFASKYYLEVMAKHYQEKFSNYFNLYNCSDGAKIEGFSPLQREEIESGIYSKEETKQYVETLFTLDSLTASYDRKLIISNLQKSLTLLRNIQRSIRSKNFKNFKKNITKLLAQEKEHSFVLFYLDTFVINLLRQINFYANFVPQSQDFFKQIITEIEEELSKELEIYMKSCEKLEKECRKS